MIRIISILIIGLFAIGVSASTKVDDKMEFNSKYQTLLKNANHGNMDAQFNLGCMYENGMEVDQDIAQAIKWYSKAAEQGHPNAQCLMGLSYEEGRGVSQSYDMALDWYIKAALQGYPLAQFCFGKLLYFGKGISQDKTEASKWFRIAAEQGLDEAQAALGAMYYLGQGGLSKNYVLAYKWLNLSAANDNKNSETLRDQIAKNWMTKTQIAEAQKLSSEWEPKRLKVPKF